ncbi:MAG: nucleotide exchange factor GrpE [Oscillospiraceae bacterium]|nr:nucleotide exchange factor GrpE [Oscillospiraceae bacterium]
MQLNKATRELDNLGRFVIPMGMRRRFEMEPGDELEVFLWEEGIAYRKPSDKEPDTDCQMYLMGFLRKLDALGRVTIPIELMRRLDIQSKDKLEVFVLGDTIAIRKIYENESKRKKAGGYMSFIKKKEKNDGEVDNQIEGLKDQLLRQTAEYDNFRKRTAKERLELVPDITADNVAAFLPVIDNIERALQAKCTDKNYKKGIEMVYESFVQTLKNLGVEEITDEDFDPAVHQAVKQVEHDTLESGKVAEIFQKGYKIGNKVIRFAMVSIVK